MTELADILVNYGGILGWPSIADIRASESSGVAVYTLAVLAYALKVSEVIKITMNDCSNKTNTIVR